MRWLKIFRLVEHNRYGNEYYQGTTYIVQYMTYPATTNGVGNDYSRIKVYTSRKRAELACKKLNDKCGRCFEVEEY